MSKPAPRSSQSTVREDGAEATAPRAVEPTSSGRSERRPYRKPVVEKRRSLSHATLVSGGGVGGTLAGGSW